MCPARRRRPCEPDRARPAEERAMPRILLVEDNPESREGLTRRLERRGYEVVLACDGRQGVEMAQSASPDLILMDINLPELDGWEVTRLIRSVDQTRGIPIIALTAHAL